MDPNLLKIKSLDDIERNPAIEPVPLEGVWWATLGRATEPTSGAELRELAQEALLDGEVKIRAAAKEHRAADAEAAFRHGMGLVKALLRRASDLEVKANRLPPSAPGGGYVGAGDAERADVGPSESVKSFLERRGKLGDPREFGNVSFGGVMRALLVGPRTEFERKALSVGVDAAGGFTVPVFLLAEVIDALRARSVVIRAGARTIPLETTKTSIARLASDPAAGWRAENAVVAESDPTFEKVEFVARSLAVLVKASRELIEDSLNIEVALRTAFAGALALKLDQAALRGTGTAPEPRGIANTTGVGSFSMTTNGAALTNYDPLLSALQIMADANAQEATAAVMAPRTLTAFDKLKDTTNQPLRRPVSIERLPFLQTTSMPVNETQGAATTASRVIAGNFAELLIGVRTEMRVEILRETFAGNYQFGFLAHLRADIQLAHPASFTMVVGIIP